MATTNKLNITEQDFFEIRNNLKTFLSQQDLLTDYDFDGSTISVLLDVLAYNTHYTAMTANMAVNEMFLDSAVLRKNIVAHAKALGYTPQSSKSSVATVTFTATFTSSYPSVTLPAGTVFESSGGNETYKFVLLESYSANPTLNSTGHHVAVFENIKLYEGKLITNVFNIVNGVQKYTIPNTGIDTSTISISRLDGSNNIPIIYASDIVVAGKESGQDLFFLDEGSKGLYTVTLGDDIIAKKLIDGTQVSVKYLKVSGDSADGIQRFVYGGGIQDNNGNIISPDSISTATVSPSIGGGGAESMESIKRNAPFTYTAQNRAVTAADYSTIIRRIFPNHDSISVWGGEDNIPPIYGKVFISINPSTGDRLTNATKQHIVDQLSEYKVASIIPEVIDPEFLYIKLNCVFAHACGRSTMTKSEVVDIITQTISDYNETQLQQFGGSFKHSNLSTLVDASDSAVISNTIRLTVEKRVDVNFSVDNKYIFNFGAKILHPHDGHVVGTDGVCSSNAFYMIGNTTDKFEFVDDGYGNMVLFSSSRGGGSRKVEDQNAGTVDYDTGLVTINSVNIHQLHGGSDYLSMTVSVDSNDVMPSHGQIVSISDIVVSGVDDLGDLSGYSANVQYKATSSRI
jgi:hypothetical protein